MKDFDSFVQDTSRWNETSIYFIHTGVCRLLELGDPNSVRFDPKSFAVRHHGFFRNLSEEILA